MTFFLLTYLAHLMLIGCAYLVTRAIPAYYEQPLKVRLAMFIGINAVFLLPLELLVMVLVS